MSEITKNDVRLANAFAQSIDTSYELKKLQNALSEKFGLIEGYPYSGAGDRLWPKSMRFLASKFYDSPSSLKGIAYIDKNVVPVLAETPKTGLFGGLIPNYQQKIDWNEKGFDWGKELQEISKNRDNSLSGIWVGENRSADPKDIINYDKLRDTLGETGRSAAEQFKSKMDEFSQKRTLRNAVIGTAGVAGLGLGLMIIGDALAKRIRERAAKEKAEKEADTPWNELMTEEEARRYADPNYKMTDEDRQRFAEKYYKMMNPDVVLVK